jgi:hypothetical protein
MFHGIVAYFFMILVHLLEAFHFLAPLRAVHVKLSRARTGRGAALRHEALGLHELGRHLRHGRLRGRVRHGSKGICLHELGRGCDRERSGRPRRNREEKRLTDEANVYEILRMMILHRTMQQYFSNICRVFCNMLAFYCSRRRPQQ